jgi:hypothetical protein
MSTPEGFMKRHSSVTLRRSYNVNDKWHLSTQSVSYCTGYIKDRQCPEGHLVVRK